MDKKAQSYGISWFFATIVISFILVLFVVASALLGLNNKNAVTFDSLKEFNNVKNLNEFHVFYEYGNNGTMNNLSYLLREGKIDVFVKDYFFSYAWIIYGLEKGKKGSSCLIFILNKDALPTFLSKEYSENIMKLDSSLYGEVPYSSLSFLRAEAPVYLVYNNDKSYFTEIISEGC